MKELGRSWKPSVTDAQQNNPPGPRPVSLGALCRFFLKLGCLAFGGPAAHIAMMEDELVRRRQWISPADFLDLLAMANLLPGPSSTELAIFIGYRLRKIPGLLIAGLCFILPAFLMVWALAFLYVRYGHLPAMTGLLRGLPPVVLAIVIQALWRLGKSTTRTPGSVVAGVIALAVYLGGFNPLFVLLSAGLVSIAICQFAPKIRSGTPLLVAPPILISSIFLVFLKFGCVIFGSGYVLLAFLRSDLVTHRGWLSDQQLLDAVAVGQVTPGPVFTTATFIGYLLGGSRGAIAATIGIFAPAFALVALTGPLIPRLRKAKWTGPMLDGFNVAAVVLMGCVSWELGRSAIIDYTSLLLLTASLFVLLRFSPNTIWLILAGVTVGLVRWR